MGTIVAIQCVSLDGRIEAQGGTQDDRFRRGARVRRVFDPRELDIADATVRDGDPVEKLREAPDDSPGFEEVQGGRSWSSPTRGAQPRP